jgi:hypothetical protein
MKTLQAFPSVDPLLRGRLDFAATRGISGIAELALFVTAFGAIYGFAMGSFGGVFTGGRWLQMTYSAVKVPLFLLAAFSLCLPSFYVVNALLGVQRDFLRAVGAIVASQACLAVALASLAPITLVCYASTPEYNFAVVFNGAPFLIASLAAQYALARGYRPLIAVNPRHRIAMIGWLILYVFVAIQLAWILRPFVGSPGLPATFFRTDALTNAYVALINAVAGL